MNKIMSIDIQFEGSFKKHVDTSELDELYEKVDHLVILQKWNQKENQRDEE